MNKATLVMLVLGLSVTLQFIAALLALRLIPISGRRIAWILVAAAIVLMALRRYLPLQQLLTGASGRVPELSQELIALVISMLMVAGMALIRPIFQSMQDAERDLRLAKTDVERQNLELRKLDRLKDGLIRDVSHELKTPVAKQAMQLELLRASLGQFGQAPVEKCMEVMEQSLRRQQQVIRNLLDLSRLEAGGRKYDRGPVELDRLIGEIIEDYRVFIESGGVELTEKLDPVTVRSDEEVLWPVFSNILSNALKFNDPRHPRISIALTSEGGRGVVRITDHGIGMSAEELARVFESFYQVSPSFEGAGVGLAICRHYIEAADGTIDLASEGRGKGTTVTVTLPQA